MNTKESDISRSSWDLKDHPSFSRKFWCNILLCEAIALGFTYGFVLAVLHADVIDKFFYEIVKKIWI